MKMMMFEISTILFSLFYYVNGLINFAKLEENQILELEKSSTQ